MTSAYHLNTAYARHQMGGHILDWAQQPKVFKEYLHRDAMPLPSPRPPRASLGQVMAGWPPRPAEREGDPDAGDLAAVCLMSAGITSRGPHGLRAPASAGALYPFELYFAASGLPGLADGIYHFTPELPGLHPLWEGSHAGALGAALGRSPQRLTFFISAIFWRSLWKYRTRAFRYCLLDAGHMLANLELALAAVGLAPTSSADFVDGTVGVMLGLAPQDEAPLAAVSAGGEPADPGPARPGLPPFDRQSPPLSAKTGRDPAILAAVEAGNLEAPPAPRGFPAPARPSVASELPPPEWPAVDLLEVVRSRRSHRNFLPAGLTVEQVSVLLAGALPEPGPLGATVVIGPGGEVPPAKYHWHPQGRLLAPVGQAADARDALARASLGQMWVGQAGLILVLWARLDHLDQVGGPRTYRHAMLAAGRAGQRLYLAATALGLGCCGVGAFYDDELMAAGAVPEGAWPLYLLACGPVKGGVRTR